MANEEVEAVDARQPSVEPGSEQLVSLTDYERAAESRTAPGATRWFQLYVFADRGVSRELVAQAVDHQYEAIVVTVDLPILGRRERDLRFGEKSGASHPLATAQAAGATGGMTAAEGAAMV